MTRTTTMMMLAGATLGMGVASPLLCSTAQADDGCSFYRVGIPDFDQRRRAQPPIEGLPGNGSMFCAPTAATNMIGYLDRLGYPAFIPGADQNWYSAAGYDQVTAAIAAMGVEMGTDAQDGTSNGFAGLQNFVEDEYPDEFNVTFWDTSDAGPTPDDFRFLMESGTLMYFCYGRYYVAPAGNGLPARRVRDGGHCVTLNEIINACTDPVIGYRDPGSGGTSETTQSGFATARWSIGPWTTWYAGDEDDQPVFKTNYILEGNFTDGRIRAIDGVRIIWPLEGLSVDVSEGILSAQRFVDLNLGLTNGVQPTHLLLPAIQAAREAAARVHRHPALPIAVVALDGGTGGRDQPGLWRCNLATREWLRLAPLPPGGGGGCFGPDGRFFFGTATGLRAVNTSNPTVNPFDVSTAGHTVLACAAGDPDHDGDTDLSDYPIFYMTRNSSGGIFIATGDVDGDGCSPYQPRPLPTAIPVPGGCDIDVNPVDGTLLVAPHGSRTFYLIDRVPGSPDWSIVGTVPVSCTPKSVHFDNKGRIVFCCDGTVNVLERNPANGQWGPKRDSRWAGLPGGDAFVLSRSRQAPSSWLNSRGNFNIDPAAENRVLNNPGTPDCPADFNNDGFIDFFDYDLFVECFEGVIESCPANNPANIVLDINNDGFVDFFDYNDFVESFERGC